MVDNKCVGCDTPIPYGSTKCPMCGAQMQHNQTLTPQTLTPEQTLSRKQDPKTTGPQKICKYCSMSIPAKAVVCPYCRKKIGMTLTGKIIAGFLVLIIGSCLIQQNKTPSIGTTTHPATDSTEKAETIIVLTGKAKAIKNQHPSWSNEDCITISKGEIHLGMTDDQVKMAWGKPYSINASVGSYGRHEQWVMYESGSTYLYFENGLLTSLQQPGK